MDKAALSAQINHDTRWSKSSKSGPYSDNCVEVAYLVGGVALRDSKNLGKEPHVFDEGEWTAFIEGAKAGEFDLS